MYGRAAERSEAGCRRESLGAKRVGSTRDSSVARSSRSRSSGVPLRAQNRRRGSRSISHRDVSAEVAKPVRFVRDHQVQRRSAEHGRRLAQLLVVRDQDMPAAGNHSPRLIPHPPRRAQHHDTEFGRPPQELALPDVEEALRARDQHAADGGLVEEQPKREDDLHRFSQPHVVGEDGAGSLPQPVDAIPLKRIKRIERRRLEQPRAHEIARSEPEVSVGRGCFLEDPGCPRGCRQRERQPDLLATLDHGRKLRIHLERPTSSPLRSRVSPELQALPRPSCGPNPKLARLFILRNRHTHVQH